MIELFMDGRSMEMAPDACVGLSASIEQITKPGKTQTLRFPFRIPMTPENRKNMKYTEQILSPELFNQNTHYGEIRCKGTTLLQGKIELTGCQTNQIGNGFYELQLVVEPPKWISDARENRLQEMNFPYETVFTQDAIQQSWTNDSPVKFLPVKRENHMEYGSSHVLLKQLGPEDYHPFVQVKALLDTIAGSAGYRIISEFLNEPFFATLYMSGNYPENTSAENQMRMNFTARKTTPDHSTTANKDGKVFASTLHSAHSAGNPVDAADPPKTTGEKENVYGNSFQMIDGRPAFMPEEDIVAGFKFRIKYKTAVSILSEEYLSGASRIVWNDEILYDRPIENPLVNYRKTAGNAGYYIVDMPQFHSGSNLLYIQTSKTANITLSVAANKQRIYIAYAFLGAECEYFKSGVYAKYENWGLYAEDDYNKLSANKEFDLTLACLPKRREKKQPVFLDTITFEGMAPGAAFTLCKETTIKPSVYSSPEIGKEIAFPALFDHNEKQIKLIEALAHLFLLHFYTDELTKTIYIEPGFTFLNHTHTIDWSHKTDTSKPMFIEDSGKEMHKNEFFRYKPGDSTVERFRASTGTDYGSWNVAAKSQFAKKETLTRENPLFTASFDEKNSWIGAADASMIVAGDKDAKEENLNFPPKIVRFLGMKALPEGQFWGWPSFGNQYPLVMFHSAGEDLFTLCFDHTGGQLGLKNYHQPRYDRINNGKKLTLYLRLTPSDVEAILHPNSANRNFRGNFTFNIRGEKIKARLVEIVDYRPDEDGSTRCVFTIEL